ncbi:protocatechuate 3,4-dioxygenase subunit alpha [Rhodococcus aetherivorans]|uniref:protocatechuate 3,4-dioxygenase subunit alpha n=1 Tax=Rhodococcus aetherivorans TaxID=191292 RepID=UPI0016398D8E|nr:protocatechuate 3,4-dioxygenase subunit alpha [Rhodococcus aetherivorans]MBC2589757.1 protocatechuate 3,4-dioxygenase subunit alpha [Rhodococcus aetherivorans]
MSEFAPRYPVTPGDQSTAAFGPTPSQTVGPYWKIGLEWDDGADVVPADTPDRITVRITVIDGNREPIADAMVETWQADAEGRFGAEGFRGFARSAADGTGTAAIHTVKPGAHESDTEADEAPHLNVGIFARGMLDRLCTRMYFPEDLAAHASDPVLTALPESQRHKLIADKSDDGYAWTVYVQDLDPNGVETPFFAI